VTDTWATNFFEMDILGNMNMCTIAVAKLLNVNSFKPEMWTLDRQY